MKKEVLITITGIQNEYERENPIKQIVAGEYYFRKGRHFLVYEEIMEDDESMGPNKCMMKISTEQVEISKRGTGNVNMNFIKNKKTQTTYPSPFGVIMTGFYTHRIDIINSEDGDRMDVELEYELEMNGNYISECEIRIQVASRDSDSVW